MEIFFRVNDSSHTVESTLLNFRVRVESESSEKSDSSRLESEFWLGLAHPWFEDWQKDWSNLKCELSTARWIEWSIVKLNKPSNQRLDIKSLEQIYKIINVLFDQILLYLTWWKLKFNKVNVPNWIVVFEQEQENSLRFSDWSWLTTLIDGKLTLIVIFFSDKPV